MHNTHQTNLAANVAWFSATARANLPRPPAQGTPARAAWDAAVFARAMAKAPKLK